MPAKSKAMQRYFGFLHAHPEEAQRRGISAKVADEFAHGPGGTTKGLPERVRKQPGARAHPHPLLIIGLAAHPVGKGKERDKQAGARDGYSIMRLTL
jgi:hypothetical protein